MSIIISDFKNLIDTYKIDNNNINEIINLMDIYFKLKSLFECDDSILKLYLPHIIFTSIALKANLNETDQLNNNNNQISQYDMINQLEKFISYHKITIPSSL